MRTLSFLTWNLALLERSAQAPLSWTAEHTEAMVRQAVSTAAPNLVLFQELPGLVPFVETHGMVPTNPTSHSGNLATLVDTKLLATEPLVRSVGGFAILTSFAEPELTVANVHLAPGPGNGGQRLAQLADIVEASPTDALLIAGDTNTRVDEMEALHAANLATTTPPRATWDSRRNRFRKRAPEFSAYFTRWFASPGVEVSEVAVLDEPLELDGHRFHLSDHYPLRGLVSGPSW